MSRQNKTVFRHELKFIIDRQTAMILKKRLENFLPLDGHSKNEEDGYRVTSLYFDDYQLNAYYDKLNGVADRTKYRIRTYDLDQQLINLEAKIKKGDLVRKEIVKLSWQDYQALLAGERWTANIEGTDFTDYFEIMQQVSLLRPKIIVDYWRWALISENGNTRITFDDHLQVAVGENDMFAEEKQVYVPVLEPEELILEVKYDDFLPAVFSQLLSGFSLAKLSVSKYVLGQQKIRGYYYGNRNLLKLDN